MGSNTDKVHSIRVTGEQNPVSNLYKRKLNSQGAVWHSVENLYQYQRAVFLDQGELSHQMISATHAHQVLQIKKYHFHHSGTNTNFLSYIPFWSSSMSNAKSGSSKLELKVPDMFWGTGNHGIGEKILENFYKI